MNRRDRRPELKELTLTASLAAAYTIFRAIPIASLIGISGTITAAGMIAPVIGILLEPAYAIVAVFAGTMIAALLPGSPLTFSGLGFLPGALNVLLVSLAVRGRRMEATLMFLIIIGLFIINPFTLTFVGIPFVSPPLPYYWLHLVALIVLVTPLASNLSTKLVSAKYRRLAIAVLVLGFTGTMIEHLTGGILFASVAGAGARKAWPAIFVVYPIERTVLVVGAFLICTPLLRILNSTVRERLSSAARVLVSPKISSLSDSETKN